jgi:hypothetical protein
MSTSFRQDAVAGTTSPVPRRGFLFFFAFAAVGAGMAVLVPAVLTLSVKATLLDPASDAPKAALVASDAPKAALGALNATKATLGSSPGK